MSAFISKDGIFRLINVMAILDAMPSEIKGYLDRELTITNVGPTTFALPLKDGRYILVKLKDREIISLDLISRY
ncbi:MAG: hypothetical protein JNN15_14200 [Blastocatellia bacterium]|nr:hypothetical protein [Blastocatellia bacterium]